MVELERGGVVEWERGGVGEGYGLDFQNQQIDTRETLGMCTRAGDKSGRNQKMVIINGRI